MSKKKAKAKAPTAAAPKVQTKAALKTQTKAVAGEKVMGFGAGTQAARMYTLLSDGKPRSVEEIHRVISDTTESHVRNGLLYALRKRGYESGEFHIVTTPEHKLRLVKGPKPEKAAKPKGSSKTQSAGRMETGAGAED